MTFDVHDPKYWDAADLQRDFTRVVEICNGCRLCDNLCPPFSDLFDRLEAEDDKLNATGHAGDPVPHLTKADYDHTVDTCYQCKLCYPKCPYTPPHEYMLDFPRLLLRADAVKVKEHGKPLKHQIRDFVTGDTDRTGKIAEVIPGVMNWAAKNPLSRKMMEATAGIHHSKKLPEYASETFHAWWKRVGARGPSSVVRDTRTTDHGTQTTSTESQITEKVALFYTCMLDQNKPHIARQYVEILWKFGIEVAMPEQECCGMPEVGTANIDKVTATVDRNIARLMPWVEKGYKIIVMSPSCSMMMRLEIENYATDKEAAKKLQAATLDPCEYLMKLHREKKIALEFKAPPPSQGGGGGVVEQKITYHVPCHLRVQNIGFQSRDLMKMIPGVKVNMIQQCSGHDGSWSAKQEYYQISLDVGKKLFKGIEKEKPAIVAGDCTLAHLHIEEGTGEHALHPIEILYNALGMAN